MAAQRAHGERSSDGNHFWMAVRLVVLMALVVAAGGVGIGSAGAASVTATPPPLLPAADQTEVPAAMQPTSLTLTPTPLPPMGSTPQATVSGLTRDAKLSGQAVNVFDDAQGNPHVAQFYTAPVNYQNAAGSWVAIQPQLVADGSGGFGNKAGPFKLAFPGSWAGASPVAYSVGGYSLSLSLAGMSTATPTLASDQQTVTYTGVLPGVDYAFTSLTQGYRDVITLRNANAPSTIVENLAVTGGIALVQESDGSIGIVDAKGAEVGAIPAPFAHDAAISPSTGSLSEGPVSYALASTGTNTYTLSLVISPTWLAQATYPVSIDPTISPGASIDTYVDDGSPNTSYSSATTLNVKAQQNSNAQHALTLFPVGTYFRTNRIVLAAQTDLYATAVANSSTNVNMKKITGGWGGGVTWNTQPSVTAQAYDTQSGTANHWFYFDSTQMYQEIFDAQANDGAEFQAVSQTTNNQIKFASSETTISGAQPVLTLQYDDPPTHPTLSSPTDGEVLNYGSPTLDVAAATDDPNGDKVYDVYQVSTSSTDFSNPIASGTVGDGDSWTVPSGILKDGTTYYWRAGATDNFQNCPRCTSWSGTRSFTVTLPHWGTDDRWSMWSTGLGNGMSMAVNEATGNLYGSYPLTSIPTKAGPLDVNLSYNSLDSASVGLGRGWILTVGPGMDPSTLPAGLGSVGGSGGMEALIVKHQDGSRLAFTDQNPNDGSTKLHSWYAAGADGGTITENNDGSTPTTYTYEPTSGGRFEFDSNGHVIQASWKSTADGNPGFAYTISGGRITQVADPSTPTPREVDITYDANNDLQQIQAKMPDGTLRTWTVGWDATHSEIGSIQDSLGRTVQFGYTAETGTGGDGQTYLTSVQDGGGSADTWSVNYTDPNYSAPGVVPPMMQVSKVTEPGQYQKHDGSTASNPATSFTYNGEQDGYTVNSTTITSANGNASTVQFDNQGLPILIDAPQETVGGQVVTPQTTMMWDKNGNLLCKRGPAANAHHLSCVNGNQNLDGYEWSYTYETTPPFALASKTAPLQRPTSTGTGPTWSYNYDEGLTGLLQENYQSTAFSGDPKARMVQTASPLTENWGSTPPNGLNAGNWAIRWTGKLHITTQGTYKFRAYANGQMRVIVSGKVLDDCWNGTDWTSSTYNCGSNQDKSVEMWPGTARVIVEYKHNAGDNGYVDVQWDGGGGGAFGQIGGANFDPGLNLLTSESAPSGLKTTYTYGGSDSETRNLPSQIQMQDTSTGGVQRTEQLGYDAYGRVLTDTNAALSSSLATTTTNTYDASKGCLSKQVVGSRSSAPGTTTNYTCDWWGDVTDKTVVVPAVSGTQQPAANQETKTTYNALGQPTKVEVDPSGMDATTSTYYTPTGALDHVVDPENRTTTYGYNERGQTTTITQNSQDVSSNQLVTTDTYDGDGNIVKAVKTWNGTTATTTRTYDAQDRVLTVATPGVSTPTTYGYDQPATLWADSGFMTSSVTTPDGVQTTTTSTFRGRPAFVQVGTQAGATPLPAEANTFDTSDNLTQSTSPNGVVTSHTYDQYNDLASTTTASGPTSPTNLTGANETTNETWNQLGQLKTSTDASSLATNYTYDGLGDLVTVVAPGPSSGTTSTFSFTYDAAGQRVEAQEPGGPSGTITRDWAYNTLGQVASAFEYPTTSTTLQTAYTYGADGELTSSTPQGGPNLCYTYDHYLAESSRYSVPLAQTCATGTQSNLETFTTSPISGPTGAVEGTSGPSVSVVYDSTDPFRVDHVTEGTTKTQYAYSPTTGQVQSAAETIGSQTNTTSYAYNSTTGLVSGVTDPFTSQQTTYQYNPDGQVSQQSMADGRVTAYTYDSAGRVVQSNTTEAGQSPLTFGVSYNLLGEITNLSQAYPAVGGNINNSGGWAYSYTPAGELSTSQFTPTGGSSGPLTTYGYDGSGNRTSVTVGSQTTTSTYDGAGRLATVGSTSYTWNNQDELTNVGSGTTYGYDAWGRLTSAAVASTSLSYSYDALNRTLSRAVAGGSATAYTYSGTGQSPTSQTVGAGTPTYYAWGASGPLAQKSGSATRFYAQDPHGDLAAVFDTAGVATGSLSYDPWGTPTMVGSDATASLLGYQSQPTDPTTGLVDMGARLYDPSQARFTTQDTLYGSPTNPLTLNQYIYAGDSPLDNSDPTGNSFACAGQCDAAKTVAYHAVQAIDEAENRGDAQQAQAYYAQASNWFAQAAAAPAPAPTPARPAPAARQAVHRALASAATEFLQAVHTGGDAAAFGFGLVGAYGKYTMTAGGRLMATGGTAGERSFGASLMWAGRQIAGTADDWAWLEHASGPAAGVVETGVGLVQGHSAEASIEKGAFVGVGAAAGTYTGGAFGAAVGGVVGSAVPFVGTAAVGAAGGAAGAWAGGTVGAIAGGWTYDAYHATVNSFVSGAVGDVGSIF